MAKKMMPKISETERVALGCGTVTHRTVLTSFKVLTIFPSFKVGFDRDIFTGSPSLKHLLDTYSPGLTKEEQAFLDNEVTTLCSMIDDHMVVTNSDLSPESWKYIRDKGFFAMKIPKEWGGKGFSTAAVSAVLMKVKLLTCMQSHSLQKVSSDN